MALGPGKYDQECTNIREETKAEGVLLMIFEGDKGSGFSCQAPFHVLADLPTILREVASQIEKSGVKA